MFVFDRPLLPVLAGLAIVLLGVGMSNIKPEPNPAYCNCDDPDRNSPTRSTLDGHSAASRSRHALSHSSHHCRHAIFRGN
jgi:hypothetical protein